MNQKLMRENEYYKQLINKIKMNKNNEYMINNSLKYKADFLVQNIVSSMKELIYLFENEINFNSNVNTHISMENKLNAGFIHTENLDNFTQSSISRENKDQFSEINSDSNNNY